MMTDEQIHEAAAELLRMNGCDPKTEGVTFWDVFIQIRRHDQIERAIKHAVAKFPSVEEPIKSAVLTVGKLRHLLERTDVPDTAIIRSAQNDSWRLIEQASFCRTANEVSLW